MDKVEQAVAEWRKVQADYKAHAAEGRRLKELEVVARHTGGDADAAEEAYKAHQNGWYELYCAERDTTARVLTELGLDKAEASAFKNAIRS